MHDHVIIVVSDGRDTMLFYDNWLPCGNLAKFMGEDIHAWGENVKVLQWLQGNRGWNIPIGFSRRYSCLEAEICKMRLDSRKDDV